MVVQMKAQRGQKHTQPAPGIPPIIDDEEAEAALILTLEEQKRERSLQYAGYRREKSGLYKVGIRSNGTPYATRILRGFADVTGATRIYRVPVRLSHQPQIRDILYSLRLRSLDGAEEQQLILSRADMRPKERAYEQQITACSVPHAKYTADFHDAINALAEAAPVERGYDSSGLILADDGPRFLNPIGPALSEHGPDEQYRVHYPPGMGERLINVPYGWERGSTPEEAIADYREALRLADLSPTNPAYGYMLLGVSSFAPMSQYNKDGGACGLVVHPTGGKKSASARVAQERYALQWGREDERVALSLRDARTKPFYVEQVTHYLAGLLLILDDLFKQVDTSDKAVSYSYGILSLVGRTASTQTGAGRSRWGEGEGGAGKDFVPRGSYLGTAEVLPDPEKHASDLAAFAVIPLVGEEPIDETVLTALQQEEAARRLNRSTYNFITWLLPRMGEYTGSITQRERFYQMDNQHGRSPRAYAKLDTGIGAYLDYGVAIGALSPEEAETLQGRARDALYHAFVAQQQLMGMGSNKQKSVSHIPIFFAALERLHREHRLYSTASAMREVRLTDGEKTRLPMPPAYLADDGIAIGERGYRFDEKEGVYIPASGAIESGVEERQAGEPVTLKVYAHRFKSVLYERIAREAREHGELLPGVSEMIAQLKKAGVLSVINNTNLHGRESQKAACYLLKLPGEEQEEQESGPDDDMPPCSRCGKRTDDMYYSPVGLSLCADCYTPGTPGPDRPGAPHQGPTGDGGSDDGHGQEHQEAPTAPDQPAVRGQGHGPTAPASRQRIAAYLDVSTGQGILDDGRKLTGAPGADLARIVRALPPEVTRLYLTGERPGHGGTLAGMQAWADAGEIALAPDWVQQQRGHYFPTRDDDTLEKEPVLRYIHRETGRKLEIRRMASWLAEEKYTPAEARAMLHALLPLLREAFGPKAFLMGTPAQTGKELWKLTVKYTNFPPLPEEAQRLIRSTSGQGRIELCPPSAPTLPALYYLDGIFMYGGLTNGLGSGPVQQDTLNEYAGYRPGRYRIRFTVPEGWAHVGLFMVHANDGEGWEKPCTPGYTGETWVDGAELHTAYQAQERMGADWHIEILERLLFTAPKGHGPLYAWAQKLIGLRESLPGRVASGQLDSRIADLIKGALRAMLLHTIGSFHRGAHAVSRRTLDASQVPTNNPTVKKRGAFWTWEEQETLGKHEAFFQHPEWSAAIWGRCRSRLLLHRQKIGQEEVWSGALTLPRDNVIGFWTDAIMTSTLPDWANGKRAGQFKVKGRIEQKVKTPRTDAEVTRLRERMKEGGK